MAISLQRTVIASLLLGMGETEDEVVGALSDLRQVGVDWVTMGQYLQPTRRHAPVHHYLPPETFDALAHRARDMGFVLVSSGPLFRDFTLR